MVFDDTSLRALRKGLLSTTGGGTNLKGDALKQGYINLGGAKLKGLTFNEDGTLSYDVLDSYGDIANLQDVLIDDLTERLVVDVGAGETVQGNVGAVKINGSTTDAYFSDATLNNADVNNGYFVSNAAGATDSMRINVKSGSNFGLNGGGSIGTVILAAGSETDPTTLNIKSSGEAVTNLVALDARTHSQVNIDGNTVVKNNATVDNLRVNEAFTVSGDTTVNGNLTSTLDPESNSYLGNLTTTNLHVLGTANYGGDINASKNATFDQGAQLQGNVTVGGAMSVAGNLTSAKAEDDQYKFLEAGKISAKSLDVSGSTSYAGAIEVTDNANFAQNAELQGDVKVGKTLTFGGDLTSIRDAEGNFPEAGSISAATLVVNGETAYAGDITADKATFGADAGLMNSNSTIKEVLASGDLFIGAHPNENITNYQTVIDTLTFQKTGEYVPELAVEATVSAGVIQGKNADGSRAAIDISVGDAAGVDEVYGPYDSSYGYLMADRIDLAGGVLSADPDYTKPASIVTVGGLGDASATIDEYNAGTLDGKAIALRNSIIAIGVDRTQGESSSIDQVKALFSNTDALKKAFKENGALNYDAKDENSVGSIIYVAKALTLTENSKLIARADKSYTEFDVHDTSSISSDISLGKNSVLAIDANAAQQTDADGKSVQAAVNFEKTGATITSDNGKIVLVGGFNPNKKIVLFKDADVDNPDTTDVDESNITLTSGSKLTVTSANGVYSKVFEYDATEGADNSIIELPSFGQADETVIPTLWADASTPVRDTLNAYTKYTGDDGNPLLDYLRTDAKSGRDAEVVARLGAFGGAAQVALAAGSTTYEAVSGRMGVGAAGANITVADNTQGAALWLTPVYKNRDSDGFGADGIDYGTDLDLYGVALGADYTLANGFKIGAAFNIGSGDADGNSAGEGVSNDFDYYGFAVYGGYTYGPWSVVADISYTNVDNDIEATTGVPSVGKVGTSFDSSNLSIGVTGQYQAILDGDVIVTPHAGLRYTKIDLDDYTVTGEDGDPVAAYASDDLSIFSIPVGVTVAKEFVNGTWTIKPSFDLTLTANMGDDSADGSVYWGVEGLDNTAVSSEVLDNFTYSATVGVAAKSGNFSLGFGLNYTGSSVNLKKVR